ncbi:CotY/CotZ family spore coat protein, partial [Bacillus cereus group sp. TH244-1LC]|uniref:CotY/CotZ family spore coat protein n=1 Tax=Bacillus cereus group sp. TH244-1LC TaxID=3018044 RepID=UPI0022E2A165
FIFSRHNKTAPPIVSYLSNKLGAVQSLTSCRSPIFRVESVDDDSCAVLRVLSVVLGDSSPVPPTDDPICTFLAVPNARLVSTSTCITVDLSCFCAIQCLRDVSI